MGIIIKEALDSDIPRAVDVEKKAYAANPVNPILMPGPPAPNARELRVQQLVDWRKNDPSITYLQVYDQDSQQLIAFAKWHVFDTDEAAAKSARPTRNWSHAMNPAACEAFFGGLGKKKQEIMGNKKHLYLHMLHTDPAFQGRGAGGLLIEWGTKKADELGLPAYLEASQKAHRLYEKYGFRDVGMLKLDFAEFGGEGTHEQPVMIREPVKAK